MARYPQGRLQLCLNNFLLEELFEVLNRPKFLARIKACNTSAEELITGVVASAKVYPDVKITAVVKSDPDDDWIISCAQVSDAQFIVTGDPHLLRLEKFRNILILSPRKFLTVFRRQSR